MYFLKLHPISGSLIAMLVSVAFTSMLFLLVHKFFKNKKKAEVGTFAQQMAYRIGALHALILSIVFSMLISEYMALQKNLAAEAATVGNIYQAVLSLKPETAARIRDQLLNYLSEVIEKEWEPAHEGAIHVSTGMIIFDIYKELKGWSPSSPYAEKIQQYVMELLLKVGELRIQRLFDRHRDRIPIVFWVIAVAGYLLTLIPYLTVGLNRSRFLLINCYALIIGVVLYGTILLSDPFATGLIKPTPYKAVYKQIKIVSLTNSK
jgi:hypothetical protein